MTSSNVECLRCRAVMEQGFVVDRGSSNLPAAASTWVSGLPELKWLTGVKTEGRKQVSLASYLCGKCGYVEFRAATVIQQ